MFMYKREKQRLSIPEKLLPGLDPEWVELWETHGSSMIRADEVTIEEYRKNPAAHGFTYPTFAGLHFMPVESLGRFSVLITLISKVHLSSMSRTYRSLSFNQPGKLHSGSIARKDPVPSLFI